MFLLKKNRINTFKILGYLGFAYFFYLMVQLTLEYIPAKSNVSFLMIKQTEVVEHSAYLPLFYIHVYTSIFVLTAGFLAIIRKDFGIKNFHQTFGKIYIFLLLIFSAPSGIYMGWFANGGIFSKLSFLILGTFWWISTFLALKFIREKNFSEHKKWMWRSFALTLSAITLRLWKLVIIYFFHPNPMDVYQIVAWLGWIPNIILIEYLIRKKLI